MTLTLAVIQKINVERCNRWHAQGVESWTGLEWAGAMCGEAGEAANIAKKLRRLEDGIVGNVGRDALRNVLIEKLGEECADVMLYCCLLASRYGIDLQSEVRAKFNTKSAEQGFPERL